MILVIKGFRAATKTGGRMQYRALEADPEFDRWYAAYPKKQARGDARKAWEQTKKLRPAIMDMLKALSVQKASKKWHEDHGQWIPFPASYLRAERWADVSEIDLADATVDGVWWENVPGVEKKARELGMEYDAYKETYQDFVARVKARAHELKAVKAA